MDDLFCCCSIAQIFPGAIILVCMIFVPSIGGLAASFISMQNILQVVKIVYCCG